jgi:hypothetical protein
MCVCMRRNMQKQDARLYAKDCEVRRTDAAR